MEFKNILWNEKETRQYLQKKYLFKKNEMKQREENMLIIKENNKGMLQALTKIHENKEKEIEKVAEKEAEQENEKEREMKSNFITRLKCEPLALNFYKSLLREFKQKFQSSNIDELSAHIKKVGMISNIPQLDGNILKKLEDKYVPRQPMTTTSLFHQALNSPNSLSATVY